MYSPTAMENAPASRPAMPAMTMAWLFDEAPATPMTRARFDTRPSLPPKTAGRRNPVARLSWGDVGLRGIRSESRRSAMTCIVLMMRLGGDPVRGSIHRSEGGDGDSSHDPARPARSSCRPAVDKIVVI